MSPRPCGADTLNREMPKARVGKGRPNAILAPIIGSFEVIMAILREIFDESAYQRFLDRSLMESSANAYAIFRQENEQSTSRRPRCC
jgi:hypothetical protein